MKTIKPIHAEEITPPEAPSIYPEPFRSQMQGRVKRKLGDHFDLNNFGVNLTELQPGALSALKHRHTLQDEMIYILAGTPTLVYGDEEYLMGPGQCFGFKAGNENAHHLVNRSENMVIYIEIGDRSPNDRVDYPDDDICAVSTENGGWQFTHKNGSPYLGTSD